MNCSKPILVGGLNMTSNQLNWRKTFWKKWRGNSEQKKIISKEKMILRNRESTGNLSLTKVIFKIKSFYWLYHHRCTTTPPLFPHHQKSIAKGTTDPALTASTKSPIWQITQPMPLPLGHITQSLLTLQNWHSLHH